MKLEDVKFLLEDYIFQSPALGHIDVKVVVETGTENEYEFILRHRGDGTDDNPEDIYTTTAKVASEFECGLVLGRIDGAINHNLRRYGRMTGL